MAGLGKDQIVKLGIVLLSIGLVLSMSGIGMASGWKQGKLLDTQQSKVLEGSMQTSNTDGDLKDKGDKVQYSSNTTTTTTDNYDTYQTYTIQGGRYIYVAREHLWFPWSKPADLVVNGPVQYRVSGDKLRLLDDNGKEHKATIIKTTLK
jgi:hypothetical protein